MGQFRLESPAGRPAQKISIIAGREAGAKLWNMRLFVILGFFFFNKQFTIQAMVPMCSDSEKFSIDCKWDQ